MRRNINWEGVFANALGIFLASLVLLFISAIAVTEGGVVALVLLWILIIGSVSVGYAIEAGLVREVLP